MWSCKRYAVFIRHTLASFGLAWFLFDRFQPLQFKYLKKEDSKCYLLRLRVVFCKCSNTVPFVLYHFFRCFLHPVTMTVWITFRICVTDTNIHSGPAIPSQGATKIALKRSAEVESRIKLQMCMYIKLQVCSTTCSKVHFFPKAHLKGCMEKALSDFWLTTRFFQTALYLLVTQNENLTWLYQLSLRALFHAPLYFIAGAHLQFPWKTVVRKLASFFLTWYPVFCNLALLIFSF